MGPLEDLAWSLPEIVDDAHNRMAMHRIVDAVDIHCAFIRQMMKDVHGPRRLFALLLVAEDEIDPHVKVSRHVLAFQRLWSETRAECGTQVMSKDSRAWPYVCRLAIPRGGL